VKSITGKGKCVSGKLIVISAPSGTGKTTLVQALLQEFREEDGLKLVVTYTTRLARTNEIHGRDYHFVTEEDFRLKAEQGFFLEWIEFCGYLYGSPAWVLDPAKRGEHSYILVLDHSGGRRLKESSDAVLIWITPPSLEELGGRLAKRGKDSEEVIKKRLQKAQQELVLEAAEKMYAHHLVNDQFEQAVKELKSLVGRVIEGIEDELK